MMAENAENNKILRLFIAVNLSKEAVSEVVRAVNVMKKIDARVKWASPETIHLTLKFLGDVSRDKIEGIKEAIRKSLLEVQPFDLSLGKLGVFPFWRNPKVIWIGIDTGKEDAVKLADLIETVMFGQGFEREKHAFRPHITIGRVKNDPKRAIYAKKINAIEIKPVISPIESVTLFSSILTPQGAVHTPVEIFSLG